MVGLAILLSACAAHPLYARDHRLRIISPADRARVHLPLTLTWSMPTAPVGESYGIFLDQAPIAPGADLTAVADGDKSCRAADGCPNAAYYARRQVYATTAHAFTIATLPELATDGGVQTHSVIIVLLDARGRRLGESSWQRDFRLDRGAVT